MAEPQSARCRRCYTSAAREGLAQRIRMHGSRFKPPHPTSMRLRISFLGSRPSGQYPLSTKSTWERTRRGEWCTATGSKLSQSGNRQWQSSVTPRGCRSRWTCPAGAAAWEAVGRLLAFPRAVMPVKLHLPCWLHSGKPGPAAQPAATAPAPQLSHAAVVSKWGKLEDAAMLS